MASQKGAGATDTTGNAQGRFTVQLPAELRGDLAVIVRAISDAVRDATGVPMEVSGAQAVVSAVRARAAELRAQAGD